LGRRLIAACEIQKRHESPFSFSHQIEIAHGAPCRIILILAIIQITQQDEYYGIRWGAWGTALAISFAPRHSVTLWARNAQQIAEMRASGKNQRYLPDIRCHPSQVKR